MPYLCLICEREIWWVRTESGGWWEHLAHHPEDGHDAAGAHES